jgi:hypothetical protein
MLEEERMNLEHKRKSIDNKLNESDPIDLLSYNEYIANARMAKKQKSSISISKTGSNLNLSS